MAVRLPARQRGKRAFYRGRRQERARDEQGASAQVGQTQRHEDVQYAEGHPGEHRQPQARADPPVTHRVQRVPQPLGLRLMRCGHQEGHAHGAPFRPPRPW